MKIFFPETCRAAVLVTLVLALPACASTTNSPSARVPANAAELDLSGNADDQTLLEAAARRGFAQIEAAWVKYQKESLAEAQERTPDRDPRDMTLWLDQYRKNFEEFPAQIKAISARGYYPLEKRIDMEGFLPTHQLRIRQGKTFHEQFPSQTPRKVTTLTFFYTQYFAPFKRLPTNYEPLPKLTLKGQLAIECVKREPFTCRVAYVHPLENILEWVPAKLGRGANSSAGGAGNDD